MDRSEELKKLVANFLKEPQVSIDEIQKNIFEKGFNMVLQGGNPDHGTYSLFQNYKVDCVAITKCHCGFIHYLEDMCIKCHPDWAMTFYANGNLTVSPQFIKELSNNDEHDDLPW